MKLKNILLLSLFSFVSFTASAASLNLSGGEAAIIQANVNTRVSCGGGQNPGGDSQCFNDNANLRAQVSQLQNDLFQCRNSPQQPKIWNCTYTCSGNNGMGSNVDKSMACRAAKQDSGVQCSSQCVCEQE